MPRWTLAVAVSACVLAWHAPALATPQPLAGRPCGLSTSEDPASPGTQVGQWRSGPLTVGDPATPAAPVTATVVCVLQLNVGTHTFDGIAIATTGTGVVTMPPGPVTFPATVADNVYLCTEARIHGGPTYHWDDPSATWTTNPATATCALAVSTSAPHGYTVA